ncbi:hypothetical protein BJI67_06870 [Acidihalobacter aeolianus]|uniref:Uncharacterized protein n=1 Tax=Acidihalobacter aeolianus TaxID=2792603 RepID=A0A1D8K7A0_9GAMM|nr:hypothetical protein BJI67_06870 [Acidihalobacter aeolianus]
MKQSAVHTSQRQYTDDLIPVFRHQVVTTVTKCFFDDFSPSSLMKECGIRMMIHKSIPAGDIAFL